MDIIKLNLFGAYIAIIILITSNLIFVFRLINQQTAEYWTGIAFMLMAIPLIYLIYSSSNIERPTLYYIQLMLMIGFIILELSLDYIFKVDFRHTKWMAISYAMFFFASTGGMIGVASQAGKSWSISAVILFLIMTALAFIQRAKTGL
jgi:hypothetical protein